MNQVFPGLAELLSLHPVMSWNFQPHSPPWQGTGQKETLTPSPKASEFIKTPKTGLRELPGGEHAEGWGQWPPRTACEL